MCLLYNSISSTYPIIYFRYIITSSCTAPDQLEVYEGEEVVDAIHRFAFVHQIHDPNAKKQLLHHMCNNRPNQAAPCTRDMALLLKATVHTGLDTGAFSGNDIAGNDKDDEDGKNDNWFVFDEGPAVPSPLVVWENEEPADIIHKCVTNKNFLKAFENMIQLASVHSSFFMNILPFDVTFVIGNIS